MKLNDAGGTVAATLCSRPILLHQLLVGGALAALIGIASAATLSAEPELLEAEKAFSLSVRMKNKATLEARFAIADGYYMYRDRFQFMVNGEPVSKSRIRWPAGRLKQDATFGKVITYKNSVQVQIPLTEAERKAIESGGDPINLSTISQGCADVGVCYPPLRQRVTLNVNDSDWVAAAGEDSVGFGARNASGERLSDRLTDKSTPTK